MSPELQPKNYWITIISNEVMFSLYSDSVYKLQSFALQSNVTWVIPYPQVLCTCSAVLGFCWSSVSLLPHRKIRIRAAVKLVTRATRIVFYRIMHNVALAVVIYPG